MTYVIIKDKNNKMWICPEKDIFINEIGSTISWVNQDTYEIIPNIKILYWVNPDKIKKTNIGYKVPISSENIEVTYKHNTDGSIIILKEVIK